MSKQTQPANFKYDIKAFSRESMQIQLPTDKEDQFISLTFLEFTKTNLELFVSEVLDINQFVNPEAAEDDRKRKTFGELAKEVSGPLCKWLGVATGKDAKFFEKLQSELSTQAFGKFLEIVYEINHIEEIMLTRGNVTVLPTVWEMMAANTEAEAKS
jgi:hypothetical protein